MTAAARLERDIIFTEMKRHAKAGRKVRLEAYTLERWARAFPFADLQQMASLNRSVRVEPYTMARWVEAAQNR